MRRTARISPRMAVLGLVVQEPGTVADVGRRLADQFAAAGFPRSSAHTNLPSLAEAGAVRLVRSGATPALDQYEAEPEGVARVRKWLRQPSLPAIPDVLGGVLAFIECEDLPAVLRNVRADEEASRDACDLAHGRVLAYNRMLRRLPRRASWRERVRMIELEYQAKTWADRSEQLGLLADKLEKLLRSTAAGEG